MFRWSNAYACVVLDRVSLVECVVRDRVSLVERVCMRSFRSRFVCRSVVLDRILLLRCVCMGVCVFGNVNVLE